ncbi:MAG: hypothetical protein WC191_07695 [Proteiniphilum sp.]|jgi:hypothetical protein|nr:hypothetical protein [Proteiniphilum sp.]NCD14181.1 hypothetical protein [Bacteroidia bacterium]MDD2726545.1 hypothetical protein [Proteiniphilum sp.]MDD3333507.1 hypothetical protein [Proteiniphilum sp.]MDD3556864.1 hypothetical protein [Proteiniphilum sp.]
MKRSIQILLTLILSALIVYGGSGVNAYFYCCDDCRSEGSEVITAHRCCEIHAHKHEAATTDHRLNVSHHLCEVGSHDNCGVERIAFSWEPSTRHQEPQPQAIDLGAVPFLLQATIHPDEVDTVIISHPETKCQKPPNLSSEVYLTLLTTLII